MVNEWYIGTQHWRNDKATPMFSEEKTCPTLSTTNSTWIDLWPTRGLLSKMPTTTDWATACPAQERNILSSSKIELRCLSLIQTKMQWSLWHINLFNFKVSVFSKWYHSHNGHGAYCIRMTKKCAVDNQWRNKNIKYSLTIYLLAISNFYYFTILEARQFTCALFQQSIKLILMAGRAKHQGTEFSHVK